jgi:hypothetical protein
MMLAGRIAMEDDHWTARLSARIKPSDFPIAQAA